MATKNSTLRKNQLISRLMEIQPSALNSKEYEVGFYHAKVAAARFLDGAEAQVAVPIPAVKKALIALAAAVEANEYSALPVEKQQMATAINRTLLMLRGDESEIGCSNIPNWPKI
jgi:predicted KAP-like P-loop ATPase